MLLSNYSIGYYYKCLSNLSTPIYKVSIANVIETIAITHSKINNKNKKDVLIDRLTKPSRIHVTQTAIANVKVYKQTANSFKRLEKWSANLNKRTK